MAGLKSVCIAPPGQKQVRQSDFPLHCRGSLVIYTCSSPQERTVSSESGVKFLEIQVLDNNVEKAIRVLKRKLQQEGLFREMKQRKYYEKPSVKRKRKEKEAQRRLRKKMRMMRND